MTVRIPAGHSQVLKPRTFFLVFIIRRSVVEMYPHFVVHEQVIFQHTILEPPFGTKIETNKAALVGSRNNLVLITDVINVCI